MIQGFFKHVQENHTDMWGRACSWELPPMFLGTTPPCSQGLPPCSQELQVISYLRTKWVRIKSSFGTATRLLLRRRRAGCWGFLRNTALPVYCGINLDHNHIDSSQGWSLRFTWNKHWLPRLRLGRQFPGWKHWSPRICSWYPWSKGTEPWLTRLRLVRQGPYPQRQILIILN